MLTIETYKKQVQILNHHAELYYVKDAPEISDAEYDRLYHEIEAFEIQNPLFIDPGSPTQRVGDKPLEKFEPFAHRQRLASLGNVFNEAELKQFWDRIQKSYPDETITFTVEPKIDGLAVACHYRAGNFEIGATRGDGSTGENVTHNLKTVASLPKHLSESIDIEVRGEVYIRKSNFEKIKDKFANPRNAAAGALRNLDPKMAKARHLDILIYQGMGTNHKSQEQMLDQLKSLGFPVVPGVKIAKSFDGLRVAIEQIEALKPTFDFEIDGAVIKVDNFGKQAELGMTTKSPRWATAYKFTTEKAITRLNNVIVQVGRTGTLTPVGVLEPVNVAGVTVSRATLHNFEEIQRKGIKVGDQVQVHRAGEVIPEIIATISSPENAEEIPIPTHCPVCEAPVQTVLGEVAIRCPNSHCPAQKRGGFAHFASRNAMDIEGLGEAVIEQLLSSGRIQTLSDLYRLSVSDLLGLERFAEKSAQNLVQAIADRKTPKLATFLYALGIPGVGVHTADVIAAHFKTIEKISDATAHALADIHEIGEKTALAIANWFSDENNQNMLIDFELVGVQVQVENQDQVGNGPLAYQTFLFTGTLSELSRSDAEKRVKSLGGKILSTISKKLNYLVVGDDPGSKLAKAKKINEESPTIQILTEAEFIQLIYSA